MQWQDGNVTVLVNNGSMRVDEVIVVGGGVSAAGDLLLDPAREAYAAHLTARMHRDIAPFEVAQMGNRAGIVGAADLAR